MRRASARSRVYFWDNAARTVITMGGLGVIVAVFGIFAYLALVTIPLFRAAHVEPLGVVGHTGATGDVLLLDTDEYRKTLMTVSKDGVVEVRLFGADEPFYRRNLVPDGRALTAFSWAPGGAVALGFDDGTVQLGSLSLQAQALPTASVPQDVRTMAVGDVRAVQIPQPDGATSAGALSITEQGQYRFVSASLDLGDIQTVDETRSAITLLDYYDDGRNRYLVAVSAAGAGEHASVRVTRPLGGGPPRTRLRSTPIDLDPADLPRWLVVTASGDSVIGVWPRGVAARYIAQDVDGAAHFREVEHIDLQADGEVTWVSKLLGGNTVLVGDASGRLSGWFVARDPTAPAPDAARLVRGHMVKVGDEAISGVGVSRRDRSLATATRGGRILVHHMTSGKRIAELQAPGPVGAVTIAPKLDAVLATSPEGDVVKWKMEAAHPEATLKSLFGAVHYEGELEPQFIYQSSAGTDDAEVKYSIVPLIVGTLKATVFAMLFAVPMGVLGAIYTSEFMDSNLRRVIKPTLELMASLPSVVLGFVAAIIVAPVLRDWLPSLLVGFIVVPIGVLLAAHLWQMIPERIVRRFPLAGLPLMGLTLLVSMAAAMGLGPAMQSALFQPSRADVLVLAGGFEPVDRDQWPDWVGQRAGMSPDLERRLRADGLYFRDGQVVRPAPPAPGSPGAAQVAERIERDRLDQASVIRWLDGGIGGPWPGWFLVLFAPAALLVYLVQARFIRRRLNIYLSGSPQRAGALELARLAASLMVITIVAAVGASLLSAAGLDTRDSIFGSYTQRNTLVIALIMGFAVIPIIYTISEDALSSVPNSLRAASLGAGATPWQTAIRIVLPVAASGIFSACMIGLGRAVGETMIVLMATGNTPVMDINIFSGMRTLAANIAVELPEAPRDETHYRVLFLCGLVLFIMTFIINTTAEIIRQYFRRRSAAL